MIYKPSTIGEQLSVNAQLQQRNSFKIIDGQEFEIPAIDFERLGMNTVHAKDKTLIHSIVRADAKSIYGEISPGGGIEVATISTGEFVSTEVSSTNSGDVTGFTKLYTNSFVVRHYIAGDQDGDDVHSANNIVLPNTFSMNTVLHFNQCDSAGRVYIPCVPVIGTAKISKGGYDQDGNLKVRQDLKMIFTTTVLSSFSSDALEGFYISKTEETASRKVLVRHSTKTTSVVMQDVGTLADTTKVAYLSESAGIGATDMVKFPNNVTRDTRLIKVSWTGLSGADGTNSQAGYITYKITPLHPMVKNSLSDTLEPDSQIKISGKQLFMATPISFTPIKAGVTTMTLDRVVSYEHDAFAQITESSFLEISNILGVKTLMHFTRVQDSPLDQSYLDVAFEVGGVKYCTGVMPPLCTGNVITSAPLINVNSVRLMSREGLCDRHSYLIDISVCGKRILISASIAKASSINALAYGDAQVTTDPYLVTTQILSFKPDPDSTIQTSNIAGISLTWLGGYVKHSEPERVEAFMSAQDATTWQRINGGSLTVGEVLRSYSLFLGDWNIVSRKLLKPLSLAYGGVVPVFVNRLYPVSHAEYKYVSAEYSEVSVFPVLYPSVSIFSTTSTVTSNGGVVDAIFAPSTYGIDSSGIFPSYPIAGQWTYHVIPWTNSTKSYCTSANVLSGLLSAKIYPAIGAIYLISTPPMDRYGTPENVTFAQDAIGAEFSMSPTVLATDPINTVSGKYVATDTNLYLPSTLYTLATVENNRVDTVAKSKYGYLAIAQYLFVKVGGATSIYSEDKNGLICVGSIPGMVIDSPVITTGGIVLASQENGYAVLYTISENGIIPFKRVRCQFGENKALLKYVDNIGLVFAVLDGVTLRMFIVRDGMVTLSSIMQDARSIAYAEGGDGSNIHVCLLDGTLKEITGLGEPGSFSIESNDFHFPLIEGMRLVLHAIKISWKNEVAKTFDLLVKTNGITTYLGGTIATGIENIITLDIQQEVGCASYAIYGATGTLRNVSWIVSPMPLLQQSIPRYAGSPPTIRLTKVGRTAVASISGMTQPMLATISNGDDFENPIGIGRPDAPYRVQLTPTQKFTASLTIPVGATGIGAGSSYNIKLEPTPLLITSGQISDYAPNTEATASLVISRDIPDRPTLLLQSGTFGTRTYKTIEILNFERTVEYVFYVGEIDGYEEGKSCKVFYVSGRTFSFYTDELPLAQDPFYAVCRAIKNGVSSDYSENLSISI